MKLICQQWEESELGWGVRPDGYSLHKSEEDRDAFVLQYWAGMPDTPPSEYSRPCGDPYEVEVDQQTYDAVLSSDRGLRQWSKPTPQPPKGSPEVWRTR